jgi:hypothetical protein
LHRDTVYSKRVREPKSQYALPEFACKNAFEQLNDNGQVYYYADSVQPDLIVNKNPNARAESIAQRERPKGGAPFFHR